MWRSAGRARVSDRPRHERPSPARPGFVSLITLCETACVLADCYEADRNKLREVLEGLLESRQIVIEASELVWKALHTWSASSADFSDALLGQVALANGCESICTFDKAATRLPSFRLLG
jgi:predicted nucleic-acid-binding protein